MCFGIDSVSLLVPFWLWVLVFNVVVDTMYYFMFAILLPKIGAPECRPQILGLAAAPQSFADRSDDIFSLIRRRLWIDLAMIPKASPLGVRWCFAI